MNTRKSFFLFTLIVFLCIPILVSCQTIDWTVKVREGQNHAAFTSLEYSHGNFYCAFREANSHVNYYGEDNGVITIMRSRSGKKWRLYDQLSINGYDLRDPKLSITPDERLMLITEAVKYEGKKDVVRKTMVTFLKQSKFEPLKEIVFNPTKPYNWLWDVEWSDTLALGFLYNPSFYAVSSTDGVFFDIQQQYKFSGFPTEAALTTLRGDMIVAVLRIEGEHSQIGVGDKTMKNIEWHDAGCRVEGPDIIEINGSVYVCGRSFDNGEGVSLYQLNMVSHTLDKVIDLPAAGDCSYPGMVFVKNRLYISYYSTDFNKTSVYISRIKL